jgi:serine/threonine protein kinase
MPEYLVRPTSYPADLSLSFYPIRIVDFGESFLSNDIPDTLHTPLPVRAPEIIFGDKLDHRVDLWSMGCMVSSDLEDICIGDEHYISRNLRGNLHFSVAFRARSRPTAVRQLYDNAHDPCPPNARDGQ